MVTAVSLELPQINTNLYSKLDELIQNPDEFLKVLGKQSAKGKDLNLMAVLCQSEGKVVKIDTCKLLVTSEIIEYVILKMPVDLNQKYSIGRSLLFYVQSQKTMRFILDKAPQLIDVQDQQKHTVLYNVATGQIKTNNNIKIVEALLLKGANTRIPEWSHRNTPLHDCKDPAVADLLLKKDPGLVFALNRHSQTPIECVPDHLKPLLQHYAETYKHLNPNPPQFPSLDMMQKILDEME